MSKSSVLIVGAGAVGMSLGYHLALAAVDVTFLVRPGRQADVAAPQHLYSYDDAALRTFNDYQVVDTVHDLGERRFDYVLVTLDGAVSRSVQGAALLREIGDAIRATDTTVIMCGIGRGLRDHYIDVMRLEDDRVLAGMLSMLSHQTGADLPIHAPTNPAALARAKIAYRHPANRIGFRIGSRGPAARRFASLYNRSGVSRCSTGDAFLVENASAFFPMFAAAELAGWPTHFKSVVANKEVWRLANRAQAEILSLPRNGLLGKVTAAVLTARMTAFVNLRMERAVRPLDYQAFSRFQHGAKVRAQDLQSLRADLNDGQLAGRPMAALEELVARLSNQSHT